MNKLAQEQSDQPIINIHSELVALGPRHRDHIPLFLRWINDFAVTRTYGMRFRNRTLEAMQENYEQGRSQIFREGRRMNLARWLKDNRRPFPEDDRCDYASYRDDT